MKKTISLILIICLLLLGISLADVRSQIDAPTNYQAVWQSNTGKTIVTVQAAVEIPATQQMMIYPDQQLYIPFIPQGPIPLPQTRDSYELYF